MEPDSNNPTSVEDLLARKAVAASTESTFSANLEEIKARAERDFNFFAGLIVPHLMRTAFPAFYLALFSLLTRINPDPYAIMRFALGLPRGFAKTTFLKILVCWLIIHDRNHFILVIGATEPKALDFIADVDEMLSSPNVEAIWGSWALTKKVDNAKRKIGYMNGKQIILVPMGAETTVRGLNINNQRPGCIICDDIQTRDGALSQVKNDSLRDWFVSSLLKSISTYGSNRLVVFLGNMYPGDCLLQVLKRNTEWVSLITGAILEDGESLWPELKPVDSLFKEYKHDEQMGEGHIWFAEVQNDPLDERYRLLSKPIPADFDDIVEHSVADYCFLTVDPAGFRRNSDDNTIAIHKGYDGVPVCTDIRGGVWDPKETVRQILVAALENGASVIGIESVGYQQSLCYWTNYFLEELGIEGITVVELKTNNRTKLSRIQDYIKELLAGTAGMAREARAKFTFQANNYKLEKTDNSDDYLDSPAYAKQILTEHSEHLSSPLRVATDLASLPPVVDVNIGV